MIAYCVHTICYALVCQSIHEGEGTVIAPPDSANTANLAVFAESGGATAGYGLTVCVAMGGGAGVDVPMPYAHHLEEAALPQNQNILNACRRAVNRKL